MRVAAAATVAAVLGVGLLVLQRWVAETRWAAILLVSAWFAVVGAATVLAVWRRPHLRLPALGTYAVIALASGAVGYWTGFRDREVNETVVTAARIAEPAEREQGLAGRPTDRPAPEAVRLAAGPISGADGHDATGRAAIVREPGGTRRLTLTDLDADPGPQVVVYLARDDANTDDVVDLGALKGNVGDQQYRIPADADLSAYDTLILWCVPFTTRIATAPLA